jgi:hypothetical protein
MIEPSMPNRWCRRAFEREVLIFAHKMEHGKLALPPDPRLEKSILGIRRLPNGRVRLLTIDESARAMMMVISRDDLT